MKKYLSTLISLLVLLPSISFAKNASLSMVYTNALYEELPFSIFSKGSWTPDPKARFVKLHLYFDEPINVKGLELDTCGTNIEPRLSMFFNFDQWVLNLDPALSGEIPEALYPKKKGKMMVFDGFENNIEIRSLTFNFENSSGFKICGVNLKDTKGEIYKVSTPALVSGRVEASSVLDPQTAYDPIFLFDSRFEYGWASNKEAKDVSLAFHFDEPKRIEKLRIWNGYQRSVTHCYSNSRAKKIKIYGDGDYKTEIIVKDILGSQIIDLPVPFEGKELKFEIVDSFLGKSYKDLVVSELRFFDGQRWFMLDPTQHLKKSIANNREQFTKAKVAALLNDSYISNYDQNAETSITSTLRLRADGSLYLSGFLGEDEGSRYFALGNYEVKDVNENGGIKLRLFGLYYETVVYGDCNGCGRDCNKNSSVDGQSEQKIFQEFVTIKPTKSGMYEVINQNGGNKIKFKKLIFSRER